jgi:glycosyltransferase involved in cell wall biosynthesis
MAGVPAIVSRRVDSEETALLASWRYASFQRIVAISDNVADAVRRSLCNAGRVVVIRSAVDTDAMQPGLPRRDWRREFGLDEDDVVLVVAAQLIERKGHRLLFEALATLPPAAPRWRLLVCGRGPLERELRQLCARLGLDPVVRFAGFRNDLDNWLGHADMLVHPACEEGLGVAMLKAAAAGLPVVALDVAGAREAVVDGQTGVLVPPADPQALAQALAALIADARQRQQLGTAGTERMRSEFSIDEMVERHLDLYRDVSRAASCVA